MAAEVWQGHVDWIEGGRAGVRATSPEMGEVLVDLPLSAFREDERHRLVEGTWIDLEVPQDGPPVPRIADAGVWTAEELDAASRKAALVSASINWV